MICDFVRLRHKFRSALRLCHGSLFTSPTSLSQKDADQARKTLSLSLVWYKLLANLKIAHLIAFADGQNESA